MRTNTLTIHTITLTFLIPIMFITIGPYQKIDENVISLSEVRESSQLVRKRFGGMKCKIWNSANKMTSLNRNCSKSIKWHEVKDKVIYNVFIYERPQSTQSNPFCIWFDTIAYSLNTSIGISKRRSTVTICKLI